MDKCQAERKMAKLVETGKYLLEARELVEPGTWLMYLRKWDISPGRARRCMKLAQAKGAS